MKKFRIPRPRTMYIHFNRIAMQRGDMKVWSVRLSDRCLHAKEILIDIPITTVYRPKGKQPRAFFKGVGYGYWVERNDGTEYLWLTSQLQIEINKGRMKI